MGPHRASDRLVEGYIIERQLGFGGMGEVDLVRDAATGQLFAVKMSQFADEDSQRSFLEELLVWIGLPPDQHIVACNFFRTAGDRIAIFAEFIEGGSLSDWLLDRELTRLGQALDIGIMSARGLARVHGLGLIHQDVKPGNILVGVDGIAKISDFGLARASARAEFEGSITPGDVRISADGMTRAYRSPEQAAHQPLTAATDIWSWGVMMLEVFAGEMTWLDGQVAAEVLESFTGHGGTALRIGMPTEMVDILRRCFRSEPSERWAGMAEIEHALLQLFRDSQQRDYPRPPVTGVPPPTGSSAAISPNDRGSSGTPYARAWLRKARAEAGYRDQILRKIPMRAASGKAMEVTFLAMFEEARQILEMLVSNGRSDLTALLAGLYAEKGLVHANCDDDPGPTWTAGRDFAIENGRNAGG